ncbi:histidinol dehydrogenase-domain-containing protein [Colletotrichum phormii]|uniref:Histidinol dehydrogenase-domain-containing protein n=1 Tax=Colletotrichum phormii TaxID=359342 RepID=A0AAI9ZE95_9PEZI|nr:histidinol dehydrogenase-domain-containing protein [Colletotrichum phormii]KAK1622672.1 histidinol dehydrogenase-domain-containing protein [Colletotrichum phormii]
MTILTAKAAGVPKVIACTPPINGQIPPSTVAAAYHARADEIWILGGVQAVAAMAIGTETMDKVDFIAHVHPKRSLIAFQRAFGNFRQTFPIQPPSN